nr:MAG TPA: hypothetical protein [Caudoviricetes sp.]
MLHITFSFVRIESLKMGKTPSQNPNQPKLSLYRVSASFQRPKS